MAGSDRAITLLEVTCSLPCLDPKVETIAPGREYAVRLRATDPPRSATVAVDLKIAVAGVGPQTIRTYVYFP